MNSTLAPVATIKADSAGAAEEDRPVANALVATVRMVVDARGMAPYPQPEPGAVIPPIVIPLPMR
jgi:hypothetical protein